MIYFLDFEDSFNHNILEILDQFGDIKTVHFTNAKKITSQIKAGDILCLGPGPGHVQEYLPFLKEFQTIFSNDKIFKLGICLGHQILLVHLKNCEINKCKKPIHGQKIKLEQLGKIFENTPTNCEVQRYNSWTVDYKNLESEKYILDSFGELAIYKEGDSLFTMQFHPESVGTSCPELFFQPLAEFLSYSSRDGVN